MPVNKLPTAAWVPRSSLMLRASLPGSYSRLEDAFAEAEYKVELKEAAELGMANTVAANKIFRRPGGAAKKVVAVLAVSSALPIARITSIGQGAGAAPGALRNYFCLLNL